MEIAVGTDHHDSAACEALDLEPLSIRTDAR
jgi:hypothetical protein